MGTLLEWAKAQFDIVRRNLAPRSHHQLRHLNRKGKRTTLLLSVQVLLRAGRLSVEIFFAMEATVTTEVSEGVFLQCFHPPIDDTGDQPSGKRWVAVLLHGWIGSSGDLSSMASELAKSGLHVYVPDLPYHGKSHRTAALSPSDAAQKLFHALNRLIPRTSDILLMGYSMGGRLVLELQRRWDSINDNLHSLKGAVIISAALPLQDKASSELAKAREEKQAHRMSTFRDSTAFDNWLRTEWYTMPMWGMLVNHPGFDALVQRKVAMYTPDSAISWGDAAVKMGTSKMEPSESKSAIPVLYIFGQLDAKYKAMVAKYKSIFPSIRCSEISQSGHSVIAEKQSEVVAEILSFILQSFPDCRLRLRVCSVKTLDYVLPLSRAMTVGNQNVDCREGFLLALTLTSGACGVGDVVPLPGWHDFTLRDAKEAIKKLVKILGSKSFDPFDFQLIADASTPDAISVAVEAALIQALATAIGTTTMDFLTKLKQRCVPDHPSSKGHPPVNTSRQVTDDNHVHINGVLPREIPGSAEDVVDVARFISQSPFQVLKLKVGNQENIADEAGRVIAASVAACTIGKSIRLDANRAWIRAQWALFRDKVADNWTNIEFIEEPLRTSDLLLQALEHNEIPKHMSFGLDETLSDEHKDACAKLMESPSCSAIVVKPSMFAGVMQVFELANKATRTETEMVISSTFESGAGLAWQAHIAACCSMSRTAHGLGTFAHLMNDVVSPSFGQFCSLPNTPYLALDKCAEFLGMCCEKARTMGFEEMDVQRHNV